MSTMAERTRKIRAHNKSRLGCNLCKKRRVKCDEKRPVCGSCERRKTECIFDYYSPDAGYGQESLVRTPSDTDSGFGSRSPVDSLQMTPFSPTVQHPLTPAPFTSLDMTSLRLFYHYCNVTSSTLAYSDNILSGLQQYIPQLAFGHPSLMHALLAVAAQHMHHLLGPEAQNADLDYPTLALTHKSSASLLLPAITDPDIYLLHLGFLSTLEYAEATGPETRDIFSIIAFHHNSFKGRRFSKDELAPFNYTLTRHQLFMESHPWIFKLHFPQSLRAIHLPESDFPWPDPDEVRDAEVSEAYKTAVECLFDSWYLFQRPGSELTAAASWCVRLSEKFYQFLVVEQRQRALVLLYYYCFMLSWLTEQDRSCWWAPRHSGISNYVGYVGFLLNEKWASCISRDAT
ncbi:transcription factor [Marasmius crinis-equi]|uniref:Transcription factor n=1 Tax=Marasmius crinis-equi TaxID=585013 RepID=A0ABR3FFH8_9AGAR